MDKKTLLVSVSLWAAAVGSVKAEDVRLDVSQAGFSAALVEQLVDEYNRQSADGTRIVLTKGDGQSADGRVVLLNTGAGIKYPDTLPVSVPYIEKGSVL